MSMRIQEALSTGCNGIKSFASSTAAWIGKTVSAAGAFIADLIAKVAEFVKPHFENLKTFVREHKQALIIATVAGAIGTVLGLVFANCCKSAPATGTGAPATGTGAAPVTV